MNPLEALQILDTASATYAGGRQDHVNILAAVNALRGFVVEHTTPEVNTPELPPVPAEPPEEVGDEPDQNLSSVES